MTKIPPDDILEGLYKLRIRESEKLKTILELGSVLKVVVFGLGKGCQKTTFLIPFTPIAETPAHQV